MNIYKRIKQDLSKDLPTSMFDVMDALLELNERVRELEGKDKPESLAKDPLAPWKTLKPGDKVLCVNRPFSEGPAVFTVSKVDCDGITFDKAAWVSFKSSGLLNGNYQILQTGPFSADKCYVGMWVWVEANGSNFIQDSKWVSIKSIGSLIYVDYKNLRFSKNGTHFTDVYHRATLHFAPPDQPTISPIEKAVEKIFDASKRFHAPGGRIDMFNNEITAILTEFKEAGR